LTGRAGRLHQSGSLRLCRSVDSSILLSVTALVPINNRRSPALTPDWKTYRRRWDPTSPLARCSLVALRLVIGLSAAIELCRRACAVSAAGSLLYRRTATAEIGRPSQQALPCHVSVLIRLTRPSRRIMAVAEMAYAGCCRTEFHDDPHPQLSAASATNVRLYLILACWMSEQFAPPLPGLCDILSRFRMSALARSAPQSPLDPTGRTRPIAPWIITHRANYDVLG